jgi:Helix-turn-helix domain
MCARPETPFQDEQNTTEPLFEVPKYTGAVLPSQGNCEMILDATAPHTRVDNFVIDEYADKIGAYGLAVYTIIKRHYNWVTGQCTPSYNRIAEMCKISRSTVKRAVKSLKAFGLIDPQMRFTDDGQTSNQYAFYQPKRPKPNPAPEQKSTSIQTDTTTQTSTPGSHRPPGGASQTPDQVDLNKREKEERNAKDVPLKEKEAKKIQGTEKAVPSEKTGLLNDEKKKCNHPESEIIRPCNGITICTACYTQLE